MTLMSEKVIVIIEHTFSPKTLSIMEIIKLLQIKIIEAFIKLEFIMATGRKDGNNKYCQG